MTVDRKAIEDMAKIMAAMNAASQSVASDDLMESGPTGRHAPTPDPAQPTGSTSIARSTLTDPNVDAMKVILERINAVADIPVDRLTIAAEKDRVLAEALKTEKTDKGARIGDWEIVVNEGADLKTYDVVSTATGQPLAKDLYLYDAAYGLVKRLNEGVTINDGRIRELLRLEEDYARNRDEAAQFKQQTERLRQKGEDVRAAIAEDRFDKSQTLAIEARERLLKLAGLR